MMDDIRVCTTTMLDRMVDDAIRQRFRKAVDPEWFRAAVDPNGMHIISMLKADHYSHNPVPVWPHHRVSVLMKRKDAHAPTSFHLDIAMGWWTALTPAIDYMAVAQEAMETA